MVRRLMSSKSPAQSQVIWFKRILIATDFSDASRNALLYATALAQYYRARLYIVHVVSSIGYKLAGPGAEVLAVEYAARDLKELWGKLGNDQSSRVELSLIVREGEVSAQLVNLIQEEHVDLIVVGTHGRTGVSKVAFGSVAEDVFRKASCPVLTVGPNSASDWPQRELGAEKAILFATDFGDLSLAALPYAASIANLAGAKLVLLHVAESAPHSEPTSIFGNAADTTTEDALRRASVKRLGKLVPQDLRVEPELRVAFGPPADAILNEAASTAAGVIALGLHHKSLFPPGRLPSTTAYGVVIDARCPVLTVRR
jgi:nucleotide-binding universal stress UspA family protein